MDALWHFLWGDGRLLGIQWSLWKVIGWVGNLVFFSRFFIQWYATEKRKQVVVPSAFWWMSIFGSLLLLIYGLYRRDSVIIFSYLFNWIPYIRNLIIHYRHKAARQFCPACEAVCIPAAHYCHLCGQRLDGAERASLNAAPAGG